jgi:MscS family membrane protein
VPKTEVYCYILTRDYNEYAAVREDLLLRMMDLVSDVGTALASPSQTLYLRRGSGPDKEKVESAQKKITELRDNKKLPFPDFHDKDISSFQGTIDYPPKESAQRGGQSGSGGKS